MSALVVDTSVWADFFRGEPLPELEQSLHDGLVWLPPVVVAEILSGKLSEKQRAQVIDMLRDLPLCDVSFDHWERVGRLRATLARKALSVSTPDAHIAQCTIDLRGRLWTRDKIFTRVAVLSPLKLVDDRERTRRNP